MVYSSFEREVEANNSFYTQFPVPFAFASFQYTKELNSMSFQDAKLNEANLGDFTEDAFVAATSLADLALSGGSKDEIQEVSLDEPGELEESKQMGKEAELLSSFCVGETPEAQFASTASEVHSNQVHTANPLIDAYDDVGSFNEPENMFPRESESSGIVVTKDCQDNDSFKVAALNYSRLNASCLTFEDSEYGSDDSFRREVGLKERSASVEKSNSTPLVDEGEEQDSNSCEDEEKTRCPCGRIENFGTMIQCDECKVWQHAKCVGFRKLSEIPEHYFCEECRPDLVRENSIFYRKKYVDMKRSRKLNRNRAELESLENIIENSEAIKSWELKSLFCKDLKKKYQTSSRAWNDEVLFRKYSKYLKDRNEVQKECVVAGLEIICGLSASEVEERLVACEKELSEREANDEVHVKDENDETVIDSMPNSIPAQGKVKKRKRTSILNDNLDIGDKIASSREERKMQQILQQFKRLEEREEKRKQKSSGQVGTSLSCGNSDDNLSARFRKASNRTTSVDSDEKYSLLIEGDEEGSERFRTGSIRDTLSASSREMDDFKVEERVWEEEYPNTLFLNLPGPSIVGSTLFSLGSSQGSITSSWTGNCVESLSHFQGYWKKEKLLKLFRESTSSEQQQYGLHSPLVNKLNKSMSPPVKKKVLMEVGSFLLSPASSCGGKTSLCDKVECKVAASSSLRNVTVADDSNADVRSQHTLSQSRTSDSLRKVDAVNFIENLSTGNSKDGSDGRVLKSREYEVNVTARESDPSSRNFHRRVYNASPKMTEYFKDMEVDSTFSSNIRQSSNRESRPVGNESSNLRRNGSHDEVSDGNTMSSNIIGNYKGRSFVGGYGENSRFVREGDRNRKERFHNLPRQWSPNKKPRKNLDAWRDFRKQNGWH
ncbi:hypothetical protein GpartN1_g3244.t1 [Galdieria partita]|uniref:Zinc finger PHD-type domain-containing protein n=1 Tax=Galdieria partita TaxID=83374 RepID=A0A9C7UQ29_9RHOD|nr:hypothetical protein GpartN1_g3244.t1 [Galdieria partita]